MLIQNIIMQISALNHNDIISQNKGNELDTKIFDNYNLLYDSFSQVEKITYVLAGTQFINGIASLIEAYMIINLRSRGLTIENSYLKTSNIVLSNRTDIINGADDLETIYDAQSKIIPSNRNGVLIGNDHIIIEAFSNTYLTCNMLKDPTGEKLGLLEGTRWIMTESELINLIDGGVEEEK